MDGAELSVMESAAANPGVLVMPPVIVPSKSNILTFSNFIPTMAAAIMGITVTTAPAMNKLHPLFRIVSTILVPADVPTPARNINRPN